MFEVGFTEIVLILGLALLVLGPEKLPGLAEKVGRWTGRARSMARQLRTQLEQEVTLEEMSKSRPAQPVPPDVPDFAPATPHSTQASTQTSYPETSTDSARPEFDLDSFASVDTPVHSPAPQPTAAPDYPGDPAESKVSQ